jgi:hypothetical protein
MEELVVRTLSQGLQAFLPVAFALAWARVAGQRRAAAAIRAGLLAALPLTVLAGYLFQRTPYQARWEATLAILAVVIATAAGRFVTARPTSAPRAPSVDRGATASMVLLAAAAALVVVRQTMEVEVTLEITAVQMRALGPTLAILSGLTAAIGAAWLWTVLAPRIPAAAAVAATRAFLAVFAVQAAFYALHECAEARFLPWSDAVHIATEPYGPDGIYGRYASLLLLGLPLANALRRAVLVDRSRLGAAGIARNEPRGAVARFITAAVIPTVCIALGVVQIGDSAAARVERLPSAAPPSVIAGMMAAPNLVFRHTGVDSGYNMLSMAALDRPDTGHIMLGLACERVAIGAGQGICLQADRGVFTTFQAVLFDRAFKQRSTIRLEGSPSRTRISADGRIGAITAFLTGHTYAASAYSTKTILVDMVSGDVLGDLEQFSTWRDGVRFAAADFNFWGVTFAHDGDTFYATLSTGGAPYLVRGDLGLRKMTVLGKGLECPSLSPDSRLIAFKKRAGTAAGAWRLYVLDLATMAERPIAAELRYVDDQVEWLDDGHVLYAMPRSGTAVTDVWAAAVDGASAARVFLREAESPIVVR